MQSFVIIWKPEFREKHFQLIQTLWDFCCSNSLYRVLFRQVNAGKGLQMATAVFSRLYIAGAVTTVVPERDAEGPGAQSPQAINLGNNGVTAEEEEVITTT